MNRQLKPKLFTVSILSLLLTAAVGHNIARADIPGNHPHYLHARTDLRKAELLLNAPDERNVVREQRLGDRQIDVAIAEIDRAAILDRKDVDDRPPVDVSLKHLDRLHEALRLLNNAHYDLTYYQEDNRSALGWRRTAVYHVDQAISDIRRAIALDQRDNRRASY